MAVSDYRDKRFLIIDSLKPSRDLLKQFAFNLAPEVVEATGYAKDIVLRCSENHYDVLLLGYDLGESQKNGQQLLEELRTNGLVNRQSVIILITAENSQAMVLAALEHKPDDYLTKPYRLRDLFERLDRCYKKKRHMNDIYKALDEHQTLHAIALCDEAIKKNTPYKTECFGIKSRQLFEQNKFDQAADIYRRFEPQKNCQWASIGLGKIALKQEKYPEAISYFSNLIDRYPLYLSSYDWLATSYEATKQPQKAQDTLERAIEISPLSVKRIERYAQLCFTNGHYEKATQAFDQNYHLSSNSIHHKPENAFKFSESLNQLAPELSDYQLKMKKNRVMNALSETAKSFGRMDIRLQTQLHSVRLMRKTNDEFDAKRLLKSSESLINKVVDELPPDSSIAIADLLIKLDRRQSASPILAKVAEKYGDELHLMTKIDKLVDEDLKTEELRHAQSALDEAANSYHKQNYQDACKRLSDAHKAYPRHIGIKLNLIQALIALFKQSNNQLQLRKSGELLGSLTGLSTTHAAYQRYKKLEQEYKQLKANTS
ncbi:response regulator [Thalassotalea sp. M1531]|uniref:Response regulator n=1 Tax=Thalassotalea algicola TaxID=2716224 RepID=A0A7Y0Q9G2_9GAMM|nr:response regulator [Thalassotalea algicola]NMP33185.1 response regulator [Thalassotalea algicola]